MEKQIRPQAEFLEMKLFLSDVKIRKYNCGLKKKKVFLFFSEKTMHHRDLGIVPFHCKLNFTSE